MSKSLLCACLLALAISLVGCLPFGATPPSCPVSDEPARGSLTGTWQGRMLQPGGPYQTYDVTMWLAQDGKSVTGITRISTQDGKYFGDIRLEGCTSGDDVRFADVQLLDDDLPFWLAWCDKTASLKIDAQDSRLTGDWRAGGTCAPGTFDLHRVADHPHVILPAHG